MERRCEAIECDFFERIPEGGDLYILSNILHDWDDGRCATILRRCREAAGPDVSLIVIEVLIPSRGEPSIAALLDLEMFVINGGKERTEDEYRILLEGAGFRISAITPTGGGVSLIEAITV
jgi:hypothetical protein